MSKTLALAPFFIGQIYLASAQDPQSSEWEQKTREKFNALPVKEISYNQFAEIEKAEFFRKKALQNKTVAPYQPQPSLSPCGNGDFESGSINPAEWSGGYGLINDVVLSGGFNPGLIGDLNTHHTVVPNTAEPSLNDGIVTSMPVKHGGSKALRLGNTQFHNGTELVSRTFTVASGQSLINFWYAVVMQNPAGHSATSQPKFLVQVKPYPSGPPITGVVDLGNGDDELIADASNPFFQTMTYNNEALVWKNWSCAQINLGSYIGQTVTVEFIVRDCNVSPPTGGGHFAYAYLDDFCGACTNDPQGWIAYDQHSKCSEGLLCFQYGLPQAGTSTGTVQIQLEILQNGAVVAMLNSPMLSSGNKYCFTFPCTSPALNALLGGFDYVATANFQIGGTTLPSKYSGSKPDGHIAGQNNDCICSHGPSHGDFCCDGQNLVQNPSFESGNTGFISQYAFQISTAADAVLPGQYAILNSAQAAGVCTRWQVKDHTDCTAPGNSKILIVDGETTQSANAGNIVWQQTIGGLEPNVEYKFCAYMKNLPACCFDVKPRVRVEITPGGTLPWTTISAGSAMCDWQLVELSFTATSTSVTIKIYLEETTKGDGNDLAIDDISLQKLPPANVQITVQNQSVSGANCQITASINTLSTGDDALPSGQNCKYVWVIGKLATLTPVPAFSGVPMLGGNMGNPTWGLTTTFPGFNCQTNQTYLVYLYVYDCDCLATGTDYQITLDNGRTQKLTKAQEKALHAKVMEVIRKGQK